MTAAADENTSDPVADTTRQRIVRAGRRRVQLTAAPGTVSEPEPEDADEHHASGIGGPNDERMRADVPPHY